MDPFTDSDAEEPFYGFRAEDIEPREDRPGSDIDVSDVSSVHTSDLSDWSDREEIEVDEEDDDRDQHGWSERTRSIDVCAFTSKTGVNIVDFEPVNGSQIDFFSQLFTPHAFATIAEQTNLYAKAKIATKPHGDPLWTETTTEEIKAYFGMLILMGIHSLPRDEMYWAADDRLGVTGISKVMSLKRYKKITEYLHLVDNADQPDPSDVNRDRLFKVRPLITMANTTFQEKYLPGREISVDEAMVPFKGRSTLRQFMPIKPVKWGMKVWCAADAKTGYILQFDVYCGRRPEGVQVGLGYSVVMQLANNYLGKFHHIYFDNFFSSVALMERLLDQNTYACATVRTNRIGLPIGMKKHRKLKKGEHIVFQKHNILATIWHDKRDVNLLSTNTSHGQDTVQRWDNRVRRKVDVPCPIVVRTYNEHMGGVDKADQMRGYYSTLKKSIKYWRYLLSFVFDAAINNAFILYDKSVPEKPKTRYSLLDYRMDLADQLIGGFSSRKKKAAKRKSQTVHPENVQSHKLIKFEGRKRACVACKVAKRRTAAGRAVESSYGCDVCQVNYCKDTCFPQHLGAVVEAAE